jgi:hypothetical protein
LSRLISHSNYSVISVSEKFKLAKQCYESVGGVQEMFRRCGLIDSSKSKREVLVNLMHESITCLDNNNQFHRNNIVCFLKWVKENDMNLQTLCKGLTVDLVSHLL